MFQSQSSISSASVDSLIRYAIRSYLSGSTSMTRSLSWFWESKTSSSTHVHNVNSIARAQFLCSWITRCQSSILFDASWLCAAFHVAMTSSKTIKPTNRIYCNFLHGYRTVEKQVTRRQLSSIFRTCSVKSREQLNRCCWLLLIYACFALPTPISHNEGKKHLVK